MNAWRRRLIIVCATLVAPPAVADDLPLTDLKWLSVDSDRVEHLTTIVPEPVNDAVVGTYIFELGRVAFRSPGLLGGVAAREGLSCQTCHVNGRGNENFFLAGLSDKPGSVDTTTSVFSKVLGDGEFNPIKIPTLVNVTKTAPYGHDGREPSLEAFVRMVIVDEFAGREPEPVILNALLAYLKELDEKDAPARETLTLSRDLNDLLRYAAVLLQALDREDRATSSFVIFAMRNHLGRIDARFPSHDDARRLIREGSEALRSIRDDVEADHFAQARTKQERWRYDWQRQTPLLYEREDASLYNAKRLHAALETAQLN